MGIIPAGMPQYYNVPWGMYPANLIPQQSSQPPPRRPLTPSQQAGDNQPPYQVCIQLTSLFFTTFRLIVHDNISNELYVICHAFENIL